jgi:hypothetical protein
MLVCVSGSTQPKEALAFGARTVSLTSVSEVSEVFHFNIFCQNFSLGTLVTLVECFDLAERSTEHLFVGEKT